MTSVVITFHGQQNFGVGNVGTTKFPPKKKTYNILYYLSLAVRQYQFPSGAVDFHSLREGCCMHLIHRKVTHIIHVHSNVHRMFV